MTRTALIGVPIDLLSLEETVDIAVHAMVSRQPRRHVAMNVAKLVKMQNDHELARDVMTSDVIGIDGMGIVLALRVLGIRSERVSGVDLMNALLARCAQSGHRPFILGAKAEVLEQAAMIARRRWPGLQFAGLRDGYFGADEEAGIVDQIKSSGADCLFVAMPTPRKERFLHRHADKLGVPFVMGVGGSVDVLAGHVSRAPFWMQRSGLEWLHRFLQEPRKMAWRYISTNAVFALLVLRLLLSRLAQTR